MGEKGRENAERQKKADFRMALCSLHSPLRSPREVAKQQQNQKGDRVASNILVAPSCFWIAPARIPTTHDGKWDIIFIIQGFEAGAGDWPQFSVLLVAALPKNAGVPQWFQRVHP